MMGKFKTPQEFKELSFSAFFSRFPADKIVELCCKTTFESHIV